MNFDWNGNGKSDAFDNYMDMKVSGSDSSDSDGDGSGTSASPSPIKYKLHESFASPNAILAGVNKTSAISAIDAKHAQLSLLLLNTPILNKDFSERILKA